MKTLITLLLLALFVSSSCLVADEAEPGVEKHLKQLGSSSFEERILAQEALKKEISRHPEEMVPIFKERLDQSKDPEVRNALKRLLKSYDHGVLIATYRFDKAAYEKGEWKLEGKGPAPKFLKGGIVELDSREVPGDALFFVRPIAVKNAKHLSVFEANVKIVEPGEGGYSAVMTLEDDVHSENLVIDSKGVNIYNRKGRAVKMPSAGIWRTFRMEGENDQLRVFVDGAQKPVIVSPWTRHPRVAPQKTIRFGDTGSRSASLVQYKDVSVKIYERD